MVAVVIFIISHHPCHCTGAQPGSLLSCSALRFSPCAEPVPVLALQEPQRQPGKRQLHGHHSPRAGPYAAAGERSSEIQPGVRSPHPSLPQVSATEHSLASRSYQDCAWPPHALAESRTLAGRRASQAAPAWACGWACGQACGPQAHQ